MLIVEGVLCTLRDDGSPHLAAMGARLFEGSFNRFLLRPFFETQSYANLRRQREGVFHVTDDIRLFSTLVVGKAPSCRFSSARCVSTPVLTDACRAFEFCVDALEPHDELRATVVCRAVHSWDIRPFLGFNRARHALLELAIAATRVHLLPQDAVLEELRRAELLTSKTGGALEQEALDTLRDYVLGYYRRAPGQERQPRG